MATARVSLKDKGQLGDASVTGTAEWSSQGSQVDTNGENWAACLSADSGRCQLTLRTCKSQLLEGNLCHHPSRWNATHPSEAFSLTSTCSTDWLDWPVSSPRFLLAIFAASGPIAASISFGSTSSNQISALVSTDLITFNGLKAVLHLYSVGKAYLFF